MRKPFARFRLLAGVTILVALSAACSDEPAPPQPCPEGTVRTAEGACETPAPTCDAEVPGSIRASCAAQNRTCYEDSLGALCGVCLSGFVEDGEACRPVVTCAELDCGAEGRECVEGGSAADAQCGACLPGSDPMADRCVPRTCSLDDAEGSIAASCAAQNRSCEEGGVEAACGGCYPGFVETNGRCRAVRTCGDLGCSAANRPCVPPTAHEDASCGGCRAGFVERGGQCIALSDATCAMDGSDPASIFDECALENRACDDAAAPAKCGGCVDGFVEDPQTGSCEPKVGCDELSCEAENRSCVAEPQGRCGACLPGFVEDAASGACRPARSCAEISCAATEDCQEATDETDAFCTPGCEAGEIWGGTQCTVCPACDDEGEDGRWPHPTTAGSCICKTRPGYFYSTAGDVGTFRCDADGDGWTRESARLGMESNDPALRANARCELRTIDRFLLVNEKGDEFEVPLERPLPLYETDRNDDQALLDVHWRSKGLPTWGSDRPITARELNRMTKVCHDLRTDYNDNGIADVQEWSGHTLGPTMRPEQRPFNEFSYFVELYRGYYREGTGDFGMWVVEEKSRLEPSTPGDATRHLAISYAEEDGDYWRECRVDPDPRWNTASPPVGMDFARYTDPVVFGGMGHHSQFKCIVVDDEPTVGAPHELTPDTVRDLGYRLNRCGATGRVDPEEVNPADTELSCAPHDAGAVQPGDVLWAAVPYNDYGPTPYMVYDGVDMGPAVYRGGCVNSCAYDLFECPRYDVNPIAVSCSRDPDNFGKFVGCDSWEVCDGLDNDGDGVADNGNPGGDEACDTGLFGACAPGTTICRDGTVQCDQNVPATTEICNSLDDDCDGEFNESFPDEGLACKVPGLKGICADGVWDCPDDEAPAQYCKQTVFPEENEVCDDVDHDCDGSPSTKGADPANGVAGTTEDFEGCRKYYYDGDGDGYPDRTIAPRCLCGPDGKYRILEPSGGPTDLSYDCCDSDSLAYPGSWMVSATPTSCGGWDYNCNGQSERTATTETAGCKYEAFKGCKLKGAGWQGTPPQCGESAKWVHDCKYNWGSADCDQKTYTTSQACK